MKENIAEITVESARENFFVRKRKRVRVSSGCSLISYPGQCIFSAKIGSRERKFAKFLNLEKFAIQNRVEISKILRISCDAIE